MHWIAYALLTFVFWGIFQFLLKVASKQDDYATMLFFALAAIISAGTIFAGYYIYNKELTEPIQLTPLILIGLAGITATLGNLFFNQAVNKGPINKVAPIVGLALILPVVLGVVILREPVNWKIVTGVVLAAASVIVISS